MIAAHAADKRTERFQFDSLEGPPSGAGNSHSEASFPSAHRPTTGDDLGGQRHRAGASALERVDVQTATVAAGQHGSLDTEPLTGHGHPVSDLHAGQLAPPQTAKAQHDDDVGVVPHASAGQGVQLRLRQEPAFSRARPPLGTWTAAATLRVNRPSATAKASSDRSVARYRLAVAGAHPDATSPPTQADTCASVIPMSGRAPNRGPMW